MNTCEKINENFIQVWKGKEKSDLSDFICNNNNNANMIYQLITEQEVIKQLTNLKTNSAPGPDKIT